MGEKINHLKKSYKSITKINPRKNLNSYYDYFD